MQKGFTLIELLMSIAIIAILSSLVLGGVNVARDKGRDTKIKVQLNNIRTAAQSYYTTVGDYSFTSSCSAGMFGTNEFGMSALMSTSNYPAGTILRCGANGLQYAVHANLSGANRYWCVDTSGSKELGANPGDVIACP